MKRVYLVYYHGNCDDGSGYGFYNYTILKKAFQTRCQAEEYINNKEDYYNYQIESVIVEQRKKNP